MAAPMVIDGRVCRFSEPRWQLTNANTSPNKLNTTLMSHSITHSDACFAYFNKIWGIPGLCLHCPNGFPAARDLGSMLCQ